MLHETTLGNHEIKQALTPKNQGFHIASNKKTQIVTESSSLKLISLEVNVRAFLSRLSNPIHSKTCRADPKQRSTNLVIISDNCK